MAGTPFALRAPGVPAMGRCRLVHFFIFSCCADTPGGGSFDRCKCGLCSTTRNLWEGPLPSFKWVHFRSVVTKGKATAGMNASIIRQKGHNKVYKHFSMINQMLFIGKHCACHARVSIGMLIRARLRGLIDGKDSTTARHPKKGRKNCREP